MTVFRLNLVGDPTSHLLGLPVVPKADSLMVDKEVLVERNGWRLWLARILIPGYAGFQDGKVTQYFLRFFQEVIGEKKAVPSDQLRRIIRLAEGHIFQKVGDHPSRVSKKMGDLERYVFAARIRLNDFASPEHKEILRAIVKRDNRPLFTKWEDLNFSIREEDKEAFWTHPDLVDFLFSQHLHRHIRYPDYDHKIEMLPCLRQRDGAWMAENEAHLKMNGRATPWSQIRHQLKVENKSNRLYSQETDGTKKYWMYLQDGFVQHDCHDMEHLRSLKTLDRPPSLCKVQVVTTHAPHEKWNFADRFLKGARHTFFRVIVGQGFQARHPDLPYRDGEVYSIGFGGSEGYASIFQPLAAVKGKFFSPDNWEFYPENLVITEFDAIEEKIVRLFDLLKQRALQDQVFHVMANNCCTNAIGVLREAEILDVPIKEHFVTMLYEYVVPEWLRYYLDRLFNVIVRHTPDIVTKLARKVCQFFYSLIIPPLFSLLGAWRAGITYSPKTDTGLFNGRMGRASNQIKALYSNIYDIFDPDRMSFDLTHRVWRWQVQYGSSTRKEQFLSNKLMLTEVK